VARQHLVYHVSHIAQEDENYCWACVFAMLLGRHSFQAAALDIAGRVPASARDESSGALLQVRTAASALGFACSPAAGLTPHALAARMRSGPVGVFGTYRTVANATGGHVTVVSRFEGDDSDASSVQLTVHDPRSGSAWTGPWSGFFGPELRSADYIVGRW
jgi:ABC-type bacteriocin/lantibiotic exporter with double-glycine peptidase domain